MDLYERLWSGVDAGEADECWEWTRASNSNGYGYIHDSTGGRERQRYAHRVAYEAEHDDIPDGLWVLHHCDNPPCCNPNHLYVGTNVDNLRDASEWDEDDIRAIRHLSDCYTYSELGEMFGMSMSYVGNIVREEVWKGV